MENDFLLSKDVKNKTEGSLQTWLATILEPFVCVKIRENREPFIIIIPKYSTTLSYVLEQP